ncbi:MAG: hypothetical protein MUF24_14190, partial [Chitinophagaceae bacterium]|nr:hypothetical protein [Chitinophagaceae bacterium]
MAQLDDDIKKLAGRYSHEPGQDLWPGIAAALDRKHRRRPVLWWWLGAAALLLGVGLWWWLPQADGLPEKQIAMPAKKVAPSDAQAPPQKGEPVLRQNPGMEQSQVDNERVEKAGNRVQKAGKFATATAEVVSPEVQIKSTTGSLIPPQNSKPTPDVNRKPNAKAQASAAFDEANTTYHRQPLAPTTHDTTTFSKAAEANALKGIPEPGNPIKAPFDATSVLADSLQPLAQPELVKVALPKADTAAAAGNPNPAVAKKQPGKPQWRLIAGAGMHNLAGKRLLQWQQSAYDFNSGLPLGNSSVGAGAPVAIMVPNKPDVGFTLGAERVQPVSAASRLGWSVGLLYQYQQLKQFSGMQQANNGLVQTDRVALPFYFAPGDTVSITGRQHRLQLIAGLHWQPGRSNRWELAGRLYGGTVLNHRYLVPLSRQAGWLPSQRVAAPAYAGLEAMVGYRLGKAQLSLAVSQNLTRAAR